MPRYDDITHRINYSEMHKFPTRMDFIDKSANRAVEECIASGKNVLFCPNDVMETHERIDNENVYVVYMFGVAVDGSKVAVKLTNLPIYFDVLVESNTTKEKLKSTLSNIAKSGGRESFYYSRMEFVTGKPLKGFSIEMSDYVRIYFKNLFARERALNIVWNNELITAEDDLKENYTQKFRPNYYFPKIAREYVFNTVSWNIISAGGYTHTKRGEPGHIINCDYCINTNVESLKAIPKEKVTSNNLLMRDKMITMTLDIETFRHRDNGEAPRAKDTDYVIFMICMTFHWKHSMDAIAQVSLVDVDSDMYPGTFYEKDIIAKRARNSYLKNGGSIEFAGIFEHMDEDSMELPSDYDADPELIKQANTIIEEEVRNYCSNNYLIICENERNLLLTLCDVFKKMVPETTVTYNGANFDWPLIREKLKLQNGITRDSSGNKLSKPINGLQYMKECFSCIPEWFGVNGSIPDEIYKRCFSRENVKVSAEKIDTMDCVLMFPGFTDTDAMVVFDRIYPTSDVVRGKSLNFYLNDNNLGSKYDMPYKKMFAIYRKSIEIRSAKAKFLNGDLTYFKDILVAEGLAVETPEGCEFGDKLQVAKYLHEYITHKLEKCSKKMEKVTKYCNIDASKCQQLYCVRSVPSDTADLATMSYMPVFESYYRANSSKVEQLVNKICIDENAKFNIKHSRAPQDNIKVKFPGAFVFPPIKGLNTKRPVMGLDFSSLYPSVMMAYNLSPDTVITDKDAAAYFRSKGYILHPIKFDATISQEGHPRVGEVIHIEAWSVRHNGILEPDMEEIEGLDEDGNWLNRNKLKGERLGLFPYILRRLFAERAVLKKQLIALTELRERMQVATNENGVINWDKVPDEYIEAAKMPGKNSDGVCTFDMDDIEFRIKDNDSRQKSKKVHMNTFYGALGYNKSSIYMLAVAGGITTAGVYNITKVADYCRENGYKIYYGDTDSVYISSPEPLFKNVDSIFNDFTRFIEEKCSSLGLEFGSGDLRGDLTPAEIVSEGGKLYEDSVSEYKTTCENIIAGKLSVDETNTKCEEEFSRLTQSLSNIVNEIEGKDLRTARLVKEAWFAARLEYWTLMVQITRRDMFPFKDRTNEMLYNDNGTRFLNLAIEEAIFPVHMTGKKKYFGSEHIKAENFYPEPEDVFVRGMDFIRQGQTKLVKELSVKIVMEEISVRNERPVCDIVEDAIRDFYTTNWDVSYFTITAKYRPNKKNVAVNNFVNRMRLRYAMYSNESSPKYNPEYAALYAPPEPGDPFNYVVVKVEQGYDSNGRMIKLGKGDKMEYLHAFNYFKDKSGGLGYEIDKNYYVQGALKGALARFVSYMPEFLPDKNEVADMDEDKIEKTITKNANNWIGAKCAKYSGENKEEIRDIGRNLRRTINRIRKHGDEALRNDIYDKYGEPGLLIFDCECEIFNPEENTRYGKNKYEFNGLVAKNTNAIINQISVNTKIPTDLGDINFKTIVSDIETGKRSAFDVYNEWRGKRSASSVSYYYREMQRTSELKQKFANNLRDEMPKFMNLVKRYFASKMLKETEIQNGIKKGGNKFEEQLTEINNLTPEDVDVLNDVNNIINNIKDCYLYSNKLGYISGRIMEYMQEKGYNGGRDEGVTENITVWPAKTNVEFQ